MLRAVAEEPLASFELQDPSQPRYFFGGKAAAATSPPTKKKRGRAKNPEDFLSQVFRMRREEGRPMAEASAAPAPTQKGRVSKKILKASLKTLPKGSKEYMGVMRELAALSRRKRGGKKAEAKAEKKPRAARKTAGERKAAPRTSSKRSTKRAERKAAPRTRRAAPRAENIPTTHALVPVGAVAEAPRKKRRGRKHGKRHEKAHPFSLGLRRGELRAIHRVKRKHGKEISRELVGYRHKKTGKRFALAKGGKGILGKVAHTWDKHKTIGKAAAVAVGAVGAVKVNQKFPDGVDLKIVKVKASTAATVGTAILGGVAKRFGAKRISSALLHTAVGGAIGTVAETVAKGEPLLKSAGSTT